MKKVNNLMCFLHSVVQDFLILYNIAKQLLAAEKVRIREILPSPWLLTWISIYMPDFEIQLAVVMSKKASHLFVPF